MKGTARDDRHLLFVVFTISGFSGLIYESIWSHYLKLFLGHAAYAQTLVLAIFMGGMALGSWLISRYSHRIANLLLGYAVVEGVIGLLGLVFHRTSVGVTSWAFNSLLPHIDSVATAQALKWSLGALLILPQSVLLGTTFPMMSGAIVRRFPARSGETLAMLYFTNSLGAAVGVLVSGFVLVGAVGLPGTILTAGLLNVALALLVWGIVKYRPGVVQPAQPSSPAASGSRSSDMVRWMLVGAAVTGIASFFYEIAWIRMLSLVLGSSTHSFEMMLSAFILGIALGGLWVRRRIDTLADPVRFLATVLMIMAIVAAVSLPIYNATFDVMGVVLHTFSATESGYVGINVASHAIAMLVMIPTTFFCGMTLPIMTHILIRGGSGERAIGAVYAWNTAGAIAGVIVGVHILMPMIGVKGLIIAGAALQLSLAVALTSTSSPPRRLRGVAIPATVAAAVILTAALFVQLDPEKLVSGVFRHGSPSVHGEGKVVFLKHGKTATISLLDVNGDIIIATNGKPDAAIRMKGNTSTADEVTMVLAGALPFALHPHAGKVANIGFGSGLTSHVLLANPTVKSLDTVEIEPLMAQAAKAGFADRVYRTFTDPRSHIYFEDAKTFFAMRRQKYDVIVSEPSNPWVSGVSTLFSREFYQQITRYLEPDGLLVQWVQIYEADLGIVESVAKALAPEFSDFAIYNTDNSNILIVATRSGALPPLDPGPFELPALRGEMARVGLVTPQDIASRFLGNKRLLMPLLAQSGVPANSDYFPFVDLHASRARILKLNALEFIELQTLPVPFFDLLTGSAGQRQNTRPSPNPTSSRDTMGSDAVTIRTALETSRYDGLDANTARVLLALRSSSEECSSPAIQRTWMASVYALAARTTTPLGASELKPIWDTITKLPCAQSLSVDDRRILNLMQAVALRDTEEVAAVGTALFKGKYVFDEAAQLLFALLATAASDIAMNRPDVALELIRDNGGRVSQSPATSLALRWLGAIALEQKAAEGTRLTHAPSSK